MAVARKQGERQATREVRCRDCPERSTGGSREQNRAVADGGEARSTDETGQRRWREGASLSEKYTKERKPGD